MRLHAAVWMMWAMMVMPLLTLAAFASLTSTTSACSATACGEVSQTRKISPIPNPLATCSLWSRPFQDFYRDSNTSSVRRRFLDLVPPSVLTVVGLGLPGVPCSAFHPYPFLRCARDYTRPSAARFIRCVCGRAGFYVDHGALPPNRAFTSTMMTTNPQTGQRGLTISTVNGARGHGYCPVLCHGGSDRHEILAMRISRSDMLG